MRTYKHIFFVVHDASLSVIENQNLEPNDFKHGVGFS